MRRILCSSLEELVQATIMLTKEGLAFKAYTDTLTISIEGFNMTTYDDKTARTIERILRLDDKYNGLVDRGKEESPEGDRVFNKIWELVDALPPKPQKEIKERIGWIL